MLNDRANPVGTWQVEITAESDATFQESSLLVFEPDHTSLCLTPGPGAGTWQLRGESSIYFEFTELINFLANGEFTGYVKVTQQGTVSTDGNAFTSSGHGVVHDAKGNQISTGRTTTRATRVS